MSLLAHFIHCLNHMVHDVETIKDDFADGVRQGRCRGSGRACRGVGESSLLEDRSVDLGGLAEEAESLRADGQTVMFLAVASKAAGLVGVADPIKETTSEAGCCG
jgi:cation transport ATPase